MAFWAPNQRQPIVRKQQKVDEGVHGDHTVEDPKSEARKSPPPKRSASHPERSPGVQVDLRVILQPASLQPPVSAVNRDQPVRRLDVECHHEPSSGFVALERTKSALQVIKVRESHPVGLVNMGVNSEAVGAIVDHPDIGPSSVLSESVE